jgi:hypothetical protein
MEVDAVGIDVNVDALNSVLNVGAISVNINTPGRILHVL